jgi:hypothetical protein
MILLVQRLLHLELDLPCIQLILMVRDLLSLELDAHKRVMGAEAAVMVDGFWSAFV